MAKKKRESKTESDVRKLLMGRRRAQNGVQLALSETSTIWVVKGPGWKEGQVPQSYEILLVLGTGERGTIVARIDEVQLANLATCATGALSTLFQRGGDFDDTLAVSSEEVVIPRVGRRL